MAKDFQEAMLRGEEFLGQQFVAVTAMDAFVLDHYCGCLEIFEKDPAVMVCEAGV
jgi:hypothetical protein